MDRTNDQLVIAFAVVLKRLRLEAGLSQEELAHRADISTRYVSFLETRRRQPSLTAFASLAAGLGLSFSEFAAMIGREYQGDSLRRDANAGERG